MRNADIIKRKADTAIKFTACGVIAFFPIPLIRDICRYMFFKQEDVKAFVSIAPRELKFTIFAIWIFIWGAMAVKVLRERFGKVSAPSLANETPSVILGNPNGRTVFTGSQKAQKRFLIAFLTVISLVMAFLTAGCAVNRYSLTDTGIVKYGFFGDTEATYTYNYTDSALLKAKTYYAGGRYGVSSPTGHVELTLNIGDERFTFDSEDFRDGKALADVYHKVPDRESYAEVGALERFEYDYSGTIEDIIIITDLFSENAANEFK